MELTPDIRHHIEVQYLASIGLLDAAMEEWLIMPMSGDITFHKRMEYLGVTATFMNYGFSWTKSEKGYDYWDDINHDFYSFILNIQDETDT